jgi:hypothetical protein
MIMKTRSQPLLQEKGVKEGGLESLLAEASELGIPDLDLLKLDRIREISIEFPTSGIGASLRIATSYPRNEQDIPIVLAFHGVRDLKLPILTGDVFFFAELVVQDIRTRQLEGISFWVTDYSVDISFYCNAISILRGGDQ